MKLFNHPLLALTGLLLFLLVFSCGGEKVESGSPEEVLLRIKEKGNSNGVLQFYTDDTISLLKKYVSLTGMKKETSVDILSFIPERSEYRISEKRVEADICNLTLNFIKHPSENAVGQPVSIRLVRMNKNWKIDRSEDFRRLIDTFEKRGIEGYLKNIR